MALAVLSFVALLLLLPLKTFEPYVVTVDRSTGYLELTRGLYQGNLTQDEAITQANLVKYVLCVNPHNPSILRENYELVSLAPKAWPCRNSSSYGTARSGQSKYRTAVKLRST